MASFVLVLVQQSRSTWFCVSWVPFIRCIAMIVVAAVACYGVCAGLGLLMLHAPGQWVMG